MSGFTVRDGAVDDEDGAGILIQNDASPTIINCRITSNFTDTNGAGIAITSSSAQIINCRIDNNVIAGAGYGGGLYVSSAGATLTNCLIDNNGAFWAGGGVSIAGSSSSVTLTNCTIADNDAAIRSGDIDGVTVMHGTANEPRNRRLRLFGASLPLISS